METKDGEVTLKGMVESHADIKRAAELARSFDDVEKVVGDRAGQLIARSAPIGPVKQASAFMVSGRRKEVPPALLFSPQPATLLAPGFPPSPAAVIQLVELNRQRPIRSRDRHVDDMLAPLSCLR